MNRNHIQAHQEVSQLRAELQDTNSRIANMAAAVQVSPPPPVGIVAAGSGSASDTSTCPVGSTSSQRAASPSKSCSGCHGKISHTCHASYCHPFFVCAWRHLGSAFSASFESKSSLFWIVQRTCEDTELNTCSSKMKLGYRLPVCECVYRIFCEWNTKNQTKFQKELRIRTQSIFSRVRE